MPSRASKPWALVVDFDGTVTVRDVADAILMRYSSTSQADIDASYRREVVTERWVYDRFLSVRTPVDTLRRFALGWARMRDGFDATARGCRERGTPVEVVSGGLDLYVDSLLDKWELGWIPRFRAASRQTPKGLHVRYRFLSDGTALDAFKEGRVLHYKRKGYRVLFAGDGPSDLRAAKAADAVYARGALRRLLAQAGRSPNTLTTFAPIRASLFVASR